MLHQSKLSGIDRYPLEKISAGSKEFIDKLDTQAFFFQALKIMAESEEQGESFGASTIECSLLFAFHRLSYLLAYELKKRKEKLTMTHLLELMGCLEATYNQTVQSETQFTEIIDLDVVLPSMFESLSHFKIADNKFLCDDLIEDLALKSIVSNESEESANLRIDCVVNEIRTAFQATLPRTDQIDVFNEVIATRVDKYVGFRDILRDPENFFYGVIDTIGNLCLSSFSSNQEVVHGERKLKTLVKKELTKFNDLINLYAIEIVQIFKTNCGLKITPTVDSIWNGFVQVVIDSYKNEINEQDIYAIPEIPVTKKSGPMMN